MEHELVRTYITESKTRFLEELFTWLRIPSVSAQKQHHADMLRAAQWLQVQLKALDFPTVELLETPGFPIVFGEKIVDPTAPTIFIYGHYDVQPAEPFELWETPPFEPTIRMLGGEEKIFARGACDDKGQAYMHLKAVETLLKTSGLPCNVKFFVEGEEEVGSSNLVPAILQHKDRLQCDAVLISDTSMIANDQPSITVGLRGLAYMEVEVTGPNRDLHSGVYGGAVANPANVLAGMIARLHDANGRVTIPGFYDRVYELSAEERAAMKEIPFDQVVYNRELDLPKEAGEVGYTTLERASIRPTLDVNGIWSGYTGQGAKTVLPAKAQAKISMRLVPHQDPDEIANLFEEHFLRLAPDTVRVKVTRHHGGKPFFTSTDSAAYRAAHRAMEQTFGKAPIPAREGGSIPITSDFAEILDVPVILLGFGLNSDALHSPNENYGTFNYFKGIETLAVFHHMLKEELA